MLAPCKDTGCAGRTPAVHGRAGSVVMHATWADSASTIYVFVVAMRRGDCALDGFVCLRWSGRCSRLHGTPRSLNSAMMDLFPSRSLWVNAVSREGAHCIQRP